MAGDHALARPMLQDALELLKDIKDVNVASLVEFCTSMLKFIKDQEIKQQRLELASKYREQQESGETWTSDAIEKQRMEKQYIKAALADLEAQKQGKVVREQERLQPTQPRQSKRKAQKKAKKKQNR